MKKLIIGRNNACDIVIPDTTDIVSRKQAVLQISFFGKMMLRDTSNNGTYVNGERLQTGAARVVTRNDTISFGRVADLDWSKVHDPYRKHKIWGGVALVALLLSCGAFAKWMCRPQEELLILDVEDVQCATPKISIDSSVQEVTSQTNTTSQTPGRKHGRKKFAQPVKKSEPNTEEYSKEHAPLVY